MTLEDSAITKPEKQRQTHQTKLRVGYINQSIFPLRESKSTLFNFQLQKKLDSEKKKKRFPLTPIKTQTSIKQHWKKSMTGIEPKQKKNIKKKLSFQIARKHILRDRDENRQRDREFGLPERRKRERKERENLRV